MSTSKNFQDVIQTLLTFWQERGCIVRQPYNVQVGAGTMNPASILGVLGPEPWNVVYVEPSIRPDDGRFGDNPNRMQMHHQLQVILQPDPGNPQELYLDSLKAIGIDPRKHDIRFVEDNWESPALGAWGLGWEVWLDGQEITQFTYFQQAGSTDLRPVAVELTYGLDRIILALQDKNSVWEIDYSDQINYADVLLQGEIEHCKYYFNVADVSALRAVYDTYEAECLRCIDAGLVIPAHDYNLKCSHLFNILDTRGAISVTDRADFFKRMRNKARKISALYIEQREQLGFPLLERNWQLDSGEEETLSNAKLSAVETRDSASFLLEIGQEELPADEVDSAVKQLQISVPALLDELRLSYDSIEVEGTPRRLAIMVTNLAARQPDLVEEKKGPPADRAFKDGKPTGAAIGFSRKFGLTPDDLQIVGNYVVATVKQEGRATVDVLAEKLAGLVAGIRFKKGMRWNASNIAYSRPLRWFVALFGSQVIEFEYANVQSGQVSRGLRPYDSPLFVVDSAENYATLLTQQNITLSRAKRAEAITIRAAELATEQGGSIPDNPDLLAEVTNLVEAPFPFVGHFDERYLSLPADILVAVMRKHQRYFPVYRADGTLVNCFIAVRNGDGEHLDTVRHGNEQVVRARFADAEFFYGNDKEKQLPDFVEELKTLMFQVDLGSMYDKTERLKKLTPQIAAMLNLSDEDTATANRAAALAKADLASNMVVEMTSLQGIMGGYYAKMSGEAEAVSQAISEQYKGISSTPPALALALADRVDSLVGLTAAGLLPKGANDPFAMRRAAIQVLENVITNEVQVDLQEMVRISAETQPIPVDQATQQKVLNFIADRLTVILRENGYSASIVRAVLAANANNPFTASHIAATLNEAVLLEDWEGLLDAYARCVRITRKQTERFPISKTAFVTEQAKALHQAYATEAAKSDGTVAMFVQQMRVLQPVIGRFFEDVMVMDKDQAIRNNRLGLLQAVAALADGIADFSELEGF